MTIPISLRWRFLGVLVLVCVPVLVLVLGSVLAMNADKALVSSLYSRALLPAVNLGALSDGYIKAGILVAGQVRAGDLSWPEGEAAVLRLRAGLKPAWADYVFQVGGAAGQPLIPEVEARMADADAALDELADILADRDAAGLATYSTDLMYHALNPLLSLIEQLEERQELAGTNRYAAARDSIQIRETILLIVLFLVAFVVIGVALFVRRRVIAPVLDIDAALTMRDRSLLDPMEALARALIRLPDHAWRVEALVLERAEAWGGAPRGEARSGIGAATEPDVPRSWAKEEADSRVVAESVQDEYPHRLAPEPVVEVGEREPADAHAYELEPEPMFPLPLEPSPSLVSPVVPEMMPVEPPADHAQEVVGLEAEADGSGIGLQEEQEGKAENENHDHDHDHDQASEEDLPAEAVWCPPTDEAARKADAMVLVAEGYPSDQLYIRFLLTRLGCACRVVGDGVEALAQLERSGYGLLLTGGEMPSLDGFGLAAAIRAAEAGGRVRLPIVALLPEAWAEAEARCRDAGMDGVLNKPIEREALERVLESLLPQALALRQPPEAAAEPEEIEIDPETLDLEQFKESFGSFDPDACAFLVSVVDGVPALLDDIHHAFDRNDRSVEARTVHALIVAAASIGAVRLGRLAIDIQGCLDAEDGHKARLMATLLRPTYEELAKAAVVFR